MLVFLLSYTATSIALGQQNIAPYLRSIAPPILACFHDPDHRVRYFACESMYNVAKVGARDLASDWRDVAGRSTGRYADTVKARDRSQRERSSSTSTSCSML